MKLHYTSALPTYRTDIDGLRALAVLSVLGYHGFPELIGGGFVGVDIFFIISGYLISSIIFNGLHNNTFSFKEFYSRRIRRIFPALALVLLSSAIAGWFLLLPDEFKQLGKHIAGGTGFISNFILWNEAGYFDPVAEKKPLLHLWSLGIEEQFYLLWPALIALAWNRLKVLYVILFITVISFTLNVIWINDNSVGVFYSPATRFWELLLGALLAAIQLHHRSSKAADSHSSEKSTHIPKLTTFAIEGGACVGLLLLVGSIIGLETDYAFPGWWALLPTAGTMLLIWTGPNSWIARYILSNRIAVWFGLISYPLYLWHWPLLTFPKILQSGTTTTTITIIALIISIILAAMTYYLIERPIRFGEHSRLKTIFLSICMVIIGSGGLVVLANDGFENRTAFTELAKNSPAISEDVSAHNYENCTTSPHFPYQELNKDFFCMKSSKNETLSRNVIIGDSHAYPMYFGMYDLYVKQRNQDLQMMGANGCPPLIGLESFEKGSQDICRPLMDKIIERINNDNGVKTVILVNRGPLYVSGKGFGSSEKHQRIIRRFDAIHPETNSTAYKTTLLNTVDTLQSHGKKVILLVTPPELGFEPRSCIETHPITISQRTLDTCNISYTSYLERSGKFRDIVNEVANENKQLVLIDSSNYLCDQKNCHAYANGHFLYSDNNHLSPSGAKKVIANSANLIPR